MSVAVVALDRRWLVTVLALFPVSFGISIGGGGLWLYPPGSYGAVRSGAPHVVGQKIRELCRQHGISHQPPNKGSGLAWNFIWYRLMPSIE